MTSEIDLWWGIALQVRIISTLIVSAILFVRLSLPFSRNQWDAWSAGAICLAILLTLNGVPWDMPTSVGYAAGLVGSFLFLWHRGTISASLAGFLTVTFFALRQISSAIGGAASSILFKLAVMPAVGEPILQFWMYALCNAGNIAASTLVLALAVQIIATVFPRDQKALSLTEFLLLSVPSFASIVAAQLLAGYRQIIDYSETFVTVEGSAALQAVVNFFTIVVVTVLFSRLQEQKHRETALQLLEAQLSSMHQYVSGFENVYEQMRASRHDLANHLQTIGLLEAQGDTGAAAAYAQACHQALGSALPAEQTGHAVTDVILTWHREAASERGAAFESSFHFPRDAALDPFDVAVILHNALTNAIDAAVLTDDPFIQVSSRQHGTTYLIEIVNSCNGSQHSQVSTDRNPAEHGFGLRNIRTAAEKHNGAIEIERSHNQFVLLVLLQLSESATSGRKKAHSQRNVD